MNHVPHAPLLSRGLAALTLLGVLATTACGRGTATETTGPAATIDRPASAAPAPTAGTAAPLPDLCAQLTAAEVADAAGVDIPFHRAEPGQGIISCAYHLGANDATPAIFVQYQLGAAGNLDFTNSGEQIRITGHRAKWYDRGAKVLVAVGEDLLIVNLGVSNKNLRGGDLRALAVELAERALENLR